MLTFLNHKERIAQVVPYNELNKYFNMIAVWSEVTAKSKSVDFIYEMLELRKCTLKEIQQKSYYQSD